MEDSYNDVFNELIKNEYTDKITEEDKYLIIKKLKEFLKSCKKVMDKESIIKIVYFNTNKFSSRCQYCPANLLFHSTKDYGTKTEETFCEAVSYYGRMCGLNFGCSEYTFNAALEFGK